MSFDSLPLSAPFLAVLGELGITEPSPIQKQCIPALLEGRDLVGQSKTGSGKTLAFGLPILERLVLSRREPQALILCPTRELATQVAREIRRFGRKLPGLSVACLVGGQPLGTQLAGLRHGTHIVVATPGRLIDHFKRGSIDPGTFETLVLDEADRMLDMGFAEEVEEILQALPQERQTALFSATFPESIEALSAAHLRNPLLVTISEATPAAQIRQLLFTLEEADKLSALVWAIREFQPEQAIIFCRQKTTVEELADCLETAGISSAGLQGDMSQQERDRVMAKFRNGSARVLVATDVAARGIDVKDLSLVVNFDLPAPDIYLHRIGRTGRAGKTGLAISFALPKQQRLVAEIEAESPLERQELPAGLEPPEENSASAPAKMATLFISGGRKEKMRPGDILGALTGEAGGFPGTSIGKIEIHDHFSYVAIAANLAQPAMHRLREGRIKGRKFRVELVR